MEKSKLFDALVARVKQLTSNEKIIALYATMYDSNLLSLYDDYVSFLQRNYENEFSLREYVMQVVDNDFYNYCDVIDCMHDDFIELCTLAKNGAHCIRDKNSCGYTFIEAYNAADGLLLVRY